MSAPPQARHRLTPPSADAVAERVAAVRRRLESVRRRTEVVRRDRAPVAVVAVTKGFTAEAVWAAMAAGISDIGENYADELLRKASAAGRRPPEEDASPACWHFLGAIQRRRVRDLARVVGTWQTVSRVSEAQAIARRAPGARVMVQVEATGLPGRNGAAPAAVPALVSAVRDMDLDLRGLMTIGPPGPAEGSRPAFRTTARLAADLGLAEVSMGMTDDLEVAVEEGATMVRVGRALFGERDVPGR